MTWFFNISYRWRSPLSRARRAVEEALEEEE